MAALTYETQNVAFARPRTDWGAIWAGVFTFAAIWSVFGVLGYAIFASAGNPAAAQPGSGVDVGMSIWAIVLTIIAMYIAGLETGRLAAVNSRHDGLIHGMIMFGLSVVAAYVIVTLGESVMTGVAPAARTSLSTVGAGLGWTGFLSLFLGWLAAMGGASSGAITKATSRKEVEPIRKAA